MRYYAGIGSRNAHSVILDMCRHLGRMMAILGYTLRTGAADGCDAAFMAGANQVDPSLVEVFTPWAGFGDEYIVEGNAVYTQPSIAAALIAQDVWESRGRFWGSISHGVQKLMARNTHQILGQNLATSPESDFVICWTENGKNLGGTAQGLALARSRQIPIVNIGDSKFLYFYEIWGAIADLLRRDG